VTVSSGPDEIDRQRAAVLIPLAEAARCSRRAARAAGEALGVSERQVFTLVHRLRAAGGDPGALRRGWGKSNGGRGRSRIARDIEQVVQQIIGQSRELAPERRTADIIAAVQGLCRERQLPPPSASTIRRRLKVWADRGPRAVTVEKHSDSLAGDPNLRAPLYHWEWSSFFGLNHQLGQLEARAKSAEAGLDRLAMGMLLVDASGQVIHLNATAERIIGAGDGIRIVRKLLDAADPHEGQSLRQLVAQALVAGRDIAESPGGVMRVGRRSGRRSYEVLVAPVCSGTIGLGLRDALVVVFVRDPVAGGATSLAWLRQLYSLTHAEARLMQGLLRGDTLDTIAVRFAITRETVRSQLKAVFSKTGASSQIELLRLGLRGLAAFCG
jgi:DNA-binding CsgD family transcriptional regulator